MKNPKIKEARAEYLASLEAREQELHDKIETLLQKVNMVLNAKAEGLLVKRTTAEEILEMHTNSLRALEAKRLLTPIRFKDNGDVWYRFQEILMLPEKALQGCSPGQGALRSRIAGKKAVPAKS